MRILCSSVLGHPAADPEVLMHDACMHIGNDRYVLSLHIVKQLSQAHQKNAGNFNIRVTGALVCWKFFRMRIHHTSKTPENEDLMLERFSDTHRLPRLPGYACERTSNAALGCAGDGHTLGGQGSSA